MDLATRGGIRVPENVERLGLDASIKRKMPKKELKKQKQKKEGEFKIELDDESEDSSEDPSDTLVTFSQDVRNITPLRENTSKKNKCLFYQFHKKNK